MKLSDLILILLEGTINVHDLSPDLTLPKTIGEYDFYSLIYDADELSLVYPEHLVEK